MYAHWMKKISLEITEEDIKEYEKRRRKAETRCKMSNKANIEEYIEIWKELIEQYKDFGFYGIIKPEKLKALENILSEIKRLEKENEEYKKQLDLDYVEENYIKRVDVEKAISEAREIVGKANKYDNLAEKIKKETELHEDYLLNQAVTSNSALDAHYRDKERYVISVLQELLDAKIQIKEVTKSNLQLDKGKAVCFDFDGVIHKYSKGWQDGSIYDEYNREAVTIMLNLTGMGIPVFICSTRNPKQIVDWWNENIHWADAILIEKDITFWNDIRKIGVTNIKLPAQLYIDDRAYRYTGQSFLEFISDNLKG